MQRQFVNNQPDELPKLPPDVEFSLQEKIIVPEELTPDDREPLSFYTYFQGFLEMYSDAATVASYLDAHEGWFRRCAQPMKAEPLGKSGYILVVGRFGSFGYEVEPKIAVELAPPDQGLYRMYTVPVPDYTPPGYEVDYQAAMVLKEIPATMSKSLQSYPVKFGPPEVITKIEWNLNLTVAIQFPQFIYKLPQTLLQNTGDRLLAQIVRQVSRRLTYKIQEDFHTRFNLPVPGKKSRSLFQIQMTNGREGNRQ